MELRRDKGDNPYPHKFEVTSSVADFLKKKVHLPEGTTKEDESVSIGGVMYTH